MAELIYQLNIERSRRKSLSFVIKAPGMVTVKAPFGMSEQEIRQLLDRHRRWIETHLEQMKGKEKGNGESAAPKYTDEEIREMADKASADIPPRVKKYAAKLGVTYGRITIRNQRTRWGSCSSAGNLNFNCLLMQTPDSVINYVVVHELCHRREMNHSKRFWALVENILPDYRDAVAWLRKNGQELIERL